LYPFQGLAKQPATMLFVAAGVRGCADNNNIDNNSGGHTEPYALVSCSSIQLRARLQSHRVPFNMPLAPGGGASSHPTGTGAHTDAAAATASHHAVAAALAQGRLPEEQVQQAGEADTRHGNEHEETTAATAAAVGVDGSAGGGGGAMMVRDGSPRSVLLVRGGYAVHRLFDFLLQEVSGPCETLVTRKREREKEREREMDGGVG
jgi:hypothetical protein